LIVLFEISKQVLENFKIQRSPNSGVQRSGDAQGDCLTKCPPLPNSSIDQWRMVVIVTG